MDETNLEYKIALLGNSNVGKTSLFKKLTTGEFSEKNISTIGMDKKTLYFEVDVNENNKIIQKNINISLVDTAGQERFRSIAKNFYKGSDGILLIYDVTLKESFKNIGNWIDNIHESIGDHNNSKYIIILIGNKIDLIGVDNNTREVMEDEAKSICEKYNLLWGGETSVKNIELSDLENLFKNYIKLVYNKVGDKSKIKQNTKKMSSYKNKKKKKFCL